MGKASQPQPLRISLAPLVGVVQQGAELAARQVTQRTQHLHLHHIIFTHTDTSAHRLGTEPPTPKQATHAPLQSSLLFLPTDHPP